MNSENTKGKIHIKYLLILLFITDTSFSGVGGSDEPIKPSSGDLTSFDSFTISLICILIFIGVLRYFITKK